MQRSRRAVLALLTLLVAWGVGATSAHADGWLPGPTLSERLGQFPHVAMGADGAATVLWADGESGSPSADVLVRRIARDGTGVPRSLGSGIALDAVATADGGSLVSWAVPADDATSFDVKVAALDAAGSTGAVRSATTETGPILSAPFGAIAPNGVVVVAWTERALGDQVALRARWIAADGTPAPIVDLGLATDLSAVPLAIGADGVARVVWRRPDVVGGGYLVARIDAAGADTTLLTNAEIAGTPQLAVGGGRAIVGWIEPSADDPDLRSVRAARLPSSGAVVDPTVTIVPSLVAPFPSVVVALAPDGTATFAWGEARVEALSVVMMTRQLAAHGALGAVRQVSSPPSSLFDIGAAAASGRDGATMVVWVRLDLAGSSTSLVSRTVGADGASVGGELPVALSAGARPTPAMALAAGPSGEAIVAAAAGTPGSGEVRLLTSRFTLTEPVGPGPGPDPGPGPGPGPGPSPAPGPGPGPGQPTARRAPARLKLTKASRAGARVTVAGTLDRRASGRVTVTWAQRVGRRTVRRTATARIARGRFSATLRLPRALARARTVGRLTVTYRGDASIARATATRSVRAAARRAARPRR
ncbi:hypothetical protein VSS74_10400 [Conexibacter stalactiti]|uniref:Uncharacterized protein n=1 Tax=Conexibacter stalactiti TaxID=1940611 RepID=A0ABU4HPU6_9ACTN|nr:hypothetical protein [Conexibacter stalactiti]MDW5594749.1 hypothetical protein [Conexibacter stalactiti]MEC5035391.1 hypothetical protein [Conexibacter stalactiti]